MIWLIVVVVNKTVDVDIGSLDFIVVLVVLTITVVDRKFWLVAFSLSVSFNIKVVVFTNSELIHWQKIAANNMKNTKSKLS